MGSAAARSLVLLGTLLAGPVWADVASDRQEASSRFRKGVQLFQRGDYGAALVEFQAAQRLAPNRHALFNVGMTQKQLFKYGEALVSFESYLRLYREDAAQRKAVEEALAEVRTFVADVEINVTGPPGAEVQVDGKRVGAAPFSKRLFWRPGSHTLRVTRKGFLSQEEVLNVLSGDVKKVTVALEKAKEAPTTATLVIETKPPKAALTIDGRTVGPSPWKGQLPAGGHQLAAALAGHEAKTAELVLSAGQTRRFSMVLERKEVSKPLFRRWYVWAALGVVAAAGTATTIYFVNKAGEPDQWLTVR